MATVVGVSFKRAGKVYYFDPGELQLSLSQPVIVETTRGMECGEIVTGRKEVAEEDLVSPLKSVIRAATPQDLAKIKENEKKEIEAFEIGSKRIQAHNIEMKLVNVEYTFDVSKIIFYFTANGRVDFRELVKDLASIFKTRIELRQIGVRDEAKMLGGLGACGRPICCRAFLNDFEPVSIKMAKEQNLLLNPTKISGLCGRLMCCLKYEQDCYDEIYRSVPRQGKEVMTPDGRGVLTQVKAIKEKLTVRVTLQDGSTEFRDYNFDEVSIAKPMTEEEKARQQELAKEAERQAELRAQRAAQKQARPPRPAYSKPANKESMEAVLTAHEQAGEIYDREMEKKRAQQPAPKEQQDKKPTGDRGNRPHHRGGASRGGRGGQRSGGNAGNTGNGGNAANGGARPAQPNGAPRQPANNTPRPQPKREPADRPAPVNKD